jgi:hypothetical protein
VLIVYPLLLAIALAWLRGGSPRHLATLPVRAAGLIVAALALKVLIYFPVVRDTALARQGGSALYICALLLVLAGVLRNRHLGKAVWLVLAGLAMNTAVIVANGGHMPANAAATRAMRGEAWVRQIVAHPQYANVELADRSSRLLPLSDIFPVAMPVGHGNVYSVGDLLIAAGVAGLAYGATRRPWGPATAHEGTAVVAPAAQQVAAG